MSLKILSLSRKQKMRKRALERTPRLQLNYFVEEIRCWIQSTNQSWQKPTIGTALSRRDLWRPTYWWHEHPCTAQETNKTFEKFIPRETLKGTEMGENEEKMALKAKPRYRRQREGPQVQKIEHWAPEDDSIRLKSNRTCSAGFQTCLDP